jgi:hypothetical protein
MKKFLISLILPILLVFSGCGEDSPVVVEKSKMSIKVYKREHDFFTGKFNIIFNYPNLLSKESELFLGFINDTSNYKISLKNGKIHKFTIETDKDVRNYILIVKDEMEDDTYYKYYIGIFASDGIRNNEYASYVIKGEETIVNDYIDNSYYLEQLAKVEEIIIEEK